MKVILTLIAIFAFGFQANADRDGYKRVTLSSKEVTTQISAAETTLTCTAMDFWGQSDLFVKNKAIAQGSFFELDTASVIFDGPCEPTMEKLIEKFQAANGSLPVTIRYELNEDIDWGISGEGTPYENRYCKKHKRETINIEGLTEGDDYLQASTELLVEEIPYETCAAATRK